MKTVDVGSVIDEGQWSGYQKLLILGTALTIILDGIDNQLLGNAVPALMKDWSLPRGAFTTVLALSPLGMMIGGAIGGMQDVVERIFHAIDHHQRVVLFGDYDVDGVTSLALMVIDRMENPLN